MQDFAHIAELPVSDQSVDATLKAAVASDAVAGVCARVVTANNTIYKGAQGQAAPDGNAVDPDGVAMIASMTKLPVTILALQLLERGAFALDTPVASIMPDIALLEVCVGWKKNAPILRAPVRPITIRHLMTHTAGMPYAVWNSAQKRYEDHADIPGIATGDPSAMTTALASDPGDAWTYGIATDWLARVVTAFIGGSLGDALRDRLFAPLALHDIGYEITPRMRARLMAMHRRNAQGTLDQTGFERPQDPPIEEGGGSLYSSVGNYARLLQLLLGGGTLDGTRILLPETVAMMFRNHIAPLKVTRYSSTQPSIAADLDLYPGVEKTFGLGFMRLEEDAPTGRPAGTVSWAGIANTYFWIDPLHGIGAVWFSQTMPFLDPAAHRAYLEFETAVYGGTA